MSLTRSATFTCLLAGIVLCQLAAESTPAHIHKLLKRAQPATASGDEALAQLFRLGDTHIGDFVAALRDPDEKVQDNAQRLIRYLGNPSGMAALRENYRGRDPYRVTGVVPVPLADWDYEQIEKNILHRDSQQRGAYPFFLDYIYALILDGSPRAQETLTQVRSKLDLSGWLSSVPTTDALTIRSTHPERELLQHAFFVTDEDKKRADVRVVSLTADGKKELLEIYVNNGPLAEQWYHIVLVRERNDWKFLSVSQVAIS